MEFTQTDYHKFHILHITHVARTFDELINDEANEGLLPEQLFLTAANDALTQREANRIEHLINTARFPIPSASIEQIDYRPGRNLNPIAIKRIAATNWTTTTRNLLLMSPTGDGKTYLTCAIGIEACHNEHINIITSIPVA